MNFYDGNGNMIPAGGDSSAKIPWLNLAHQGKAEEIYGNSIYSFTRTQEYGMDGTELDLRMTADNVIVCSHEAVLTGTINGVEQTMTIISSNWEDLSQLTLFTLDGVDYHPLRFDSLCRMAFYWDWKMLQLDFKSQGNTQACQIKASEIIRDNGLCGKAMYLGTNESVAESILANDPLALFSVGRNTDMTGTVYEDIAVTQVWRGVYSDDLPNYIKDGHPFYVWNAGPTSADRIMSYKPNGIQWQRDTDGVSLSETYLANVDWE